MPKGRPTEYTPELLEKAREYLENLPEDEVVHSIEGLAIYINIARSTIYDWLGQDGKEDFSDIVSSVLAKQGKTLINKGLKQEFSSPITKVMLTKHGYREGIEQTGKDGAPLTIALEDKEKIEEALNAI